MINRRRFMQLVGAAFVPVPAIAAAEQEFHLVGDGIHNDGPALNALLAGKPVSVGPLVDFTDAGWFGDTFKMPKGRFLSLETLVFRHDREGYVTIDFAWSLPRFCRDVGNTICVYGPGRFSLKSVGREGAAPGGGIRISQPLEYD